MKHIYFFALPVKPDVFQYIGNTSKVIHLQPVIKQGVGFRFELEFIYCANK